VFFVSVFVLDQGRQDLWMMKTKEETDCEEQQEEEEKEVSEWI